MKRDERAERRFLSPLVSSSLLLRRMHDVQPDTTTVRQMSEVTSNVDLPDALFDPQRLRTTVVSPLWQPYRAQARRHVSEVQAIPNANVLLALRAISSDRNLHVNFAQCGGHYLSNVHETIQNAKGAMVLESAAQGPWLFAKLPQGRTQSWLTCLVQRNNTSRRCRQRDPQTPLVLVSGTDVTGRGTQRIGST